ncbi:MAG: cadherin-like domain-containing protein, partial [Pseudomonadales bacterium]|nr:cadherin-like domain-containing protein [Pseudomonadales bacterium]
SDSAMLSVTVVGVNEAPIAAADVVAVAANAIATGSVLSNDIDADLTDVIFVAAVEGNAVNVGMPVLLSSGALITVNSGGNFSYDTNGVFSALASGISITDVISYRLADGNGGTSTSTLTIIVNGQNSAPVVSGSANIILSEDDVVTSLNLLAGVTDPDGDPLNVSGLTVISGNNGGIAISGNQLSISPGFYTALQGGQTETVTYSYQVDDGVGNFVPQFANVTITGVNDSPLAVSDFDSTSESISLINIMPGVLANDTDPDVGASLTVSAVQGVGGNVGNAVTLGSGSIFVIRSNGSYDYIPAIDLALGQTATESISYTITDGFGGVSNALLTVTIAGENESPTAASSFFSAPESIAFPSGIGVLNNALDADPGDVLVFASADNSGVNILPNVLTVLASGATIIIDNNGVFTFDASDSRFHRGLATNEVFQENFNFTISDVVGATATSTFSVDVRGESPPDIIYGSHGGAVLVDPNLEIVGDQMADIQDALITVAGFYNPDSKIISVFDTGDDVGTSTQSISFVASTNVQSLSREIFAIAENRFLTDDRLPSLTVEGQLNPLNDVWDSYSVDLKAGEILIMDVDGGALLGLDGDLELSLYNGASVLIAQNNDGGVFDEGSDVELDPYLVYRSTSTDTYTIVVAQEVVIDGSGVAFGAAATDHIDYTLNLSIQNSADEFFDHQVTIVDETENEATNFIPDLGANKGILLERQDFKIADNQLVGDETLPRVTIIGELLEDDTADSFQFVYKANDILTFDVDFGFAATPVDLLLELRDSNGMVIAFNDDFGTLDPGSISALDSLLTYTNPTTTEVLTLTISPLIAGFSGDYILHSSLNPVEGLAGFLSGSTVLNERGSTAIEFRPEAVANEIEVDAQFGINAFNNGDGSIALFGATTPANFEQILQTFSFESLLSDPTSQNFEVEFFAVDDGGDSFRITSRIIQQNSTEIQLSEVNNSNGVDGAFVAAKFNRFAKPESLFNSGDTNGDGFGDIILSDDNTVTVFYGSDNEAPNLDNFLSTELTFNDLAATRTNISIKNVSHAGDINGDGFDDLVGDVSYYDNTTTYNQTFVLFGKDNSGLTNIAGSDEIIDVDFLGATNVGLNINADRISAVGDIDGDGFDDLLATNTSGSNSLLIFGQAVFPVAELINDLIEPTANFAQHLKLNSSFVDFDNKSLLHGFSSSAYTNEVNAAGDINGDGFNDLFLTFDNYDVIYTVFGNSRSGLLSRTDGSGDFLIEDLFADVNSKAIFADGRGQLEIQSVRPIADVNGDGFDDIAVNIAYLNYASYAKYLGDRVGTFVIFGGPTLLGFSAEVHQDGGLFISDLASTDGSAGFRITSSELEESSHAANVVFSNIVGAGDINGDGFNDLIALPYISDVYGDHRPANLKTGDPVIVFGGPVLETTGGNLDVSSLSGDRGIEVRAEFHNDDYNYSNLIEAAGDFNGDGFDDFYLYNDLLDNNDVGVYDSPLNLATPGTSVVFGINDPASSNITGSSLSDNVFGRPGAQVIHAGAGDDLIEYDAADNLSVDGGGGQDTVDVISAFENIDLTVNNPFSNIEIFSLNDNNSSLTLTFDEVLTITDGDPTLVALTGSAHNLVVTGGSTDQIVTADAGWIAAGSSTFNSIAVNVYTNGQASLLVEQNIDQSGIQSGFGIVDQNQMASGLTGTAGINVNGGILTEINGSPFTQGTFFSLANGVMLRVDNASTGMFSYDASVAFAELAMVENGFIDFEFSVFDGTNVDFGRYSLAVGGLVNDPLTVNFNGFVPIYNAGSLSAPLVDNGFQISDPDTNYLNSVSITSNGGGKFFVAGGSPNINFSSGTAVSITSAPGLAVFSREDAVEFIKQISYLPSASDTTPVTISYAFFSDTTSTATQTITLTAQPDDSTAAGGLWSVPGTWVDGVPPTAVDDVILLGLASTLTSSTAGDLAANLVLNSASGMVAVDSVSLDISAGKVFLLDGVATAGIDVSASSADATLVAQDILVASGETLTLSSSTSFTAGLVASNSIKVAGTLAAQFFPTSTTTVTVETAEFDLSEGVLDLRSSGGPPAVTNLIANNPGSVMDLVVSDQTVLKGHLNSFVDLLNTRIVMQSDFDLFGYNDDTTSTPAPALNLVGDGEISGPHIFTNHRNDFLFDSDDLGGLATLINQGEIVFKADSNLFGVFENYTKAVFRDANINSSNHLFNAAFGEFVLGDTGTMTATSILTQSDDFKIINAGTISAVDPGQVIDANIDSSGEIFVSTNGGLTIANDNHLLNLAEGFIRVESGGVLLLDGGDIVVDNGTIFNVDTPSGIDFINGAQVHNGAAALIVDPTMASKGLQLRGPFQFGSLSLDVLKNAALGTLNTALNLVSLSFLGVAEMITKSFWEPQIDKGLAATDNVDFETIRLGGTISPIVQGGTALVAGNSFVLLSANEMFDSFAYFKNTIEPGGLVTNLVYDFTVGAASVTYEVLNPTQVTPVAGAFNGTAAADVILGSDNNLLYQNIGAGDIVIAEGTGVETFIAASFDFVRIAAAEMSSLNKLVLNAPGVFDFIALPGTALENISEIGLSPGIQNLLFDEASILNVLDQANNILAISSTDGVEGDRVIILGDYFEGAVGTSVEFFSSSASLLVQQDIEVEIHRSDGDNAYYGTNGGETLVGSDQNDFIDARSGNDVIIALNGDDAVVFDNADLGSIDAGSGLDSLLLDGDMLDLTMTNNLTNFEKIELDGAASTVKLNFADLFGGGNFLENGLIDAFSTDSAFADHQLFITGSSAGSSFFIENVDLFAGNASLFSDLSAAGVVLGQATDIFGQDVLPFTKGDVTLFITQQLFDQATNFI